MTLQPGNRLGNYEIVEKIGAGGMGAVYKAYQPALGRFVAIKVLPPQTSGDPAFAERFAQEARAIGKLRHPNIVAAFDFAHEGEIAYLASEFIDGGTLADQLGTPLPLEYALQILAPIAAALDYAHSRGVVHRDIKPQNVLMTREGTPVLTDFGLAKIVGPGSGMTQAGSLMGTAEYIAPECAGGAEMAGPPADQYALALIAYQMLVGQHPFPSDNPLSALMAHVHKPVPLPSALGIALPPATEAALLRGLSKAPQGRFPRCSDLVRALAGSQMHAVLPAPERAPSQPPTTSPAIASVSALVRPPESSPPAPAPGAPAAAATLATVAPRPLAAAVPPWWRRRRMLVLPAILVVFVLGSLQERDRRLAGAGATNAPPTGARTNAPAVVPTGQTTPTLTVRPTGQPTATVRPTVAPTTIVTAPPTVAPTAPPKDDHGDTPLQASPVSTGVHNGTIEEAGDVDWFRFAVDGPRQIAIEFRGLTLRNGAIALYLGTGATGQATLVAEETDTGNGVRINHGAKEPGVYLIRVRGTRDTTGTYGFGLVTR